MLMKLNIIFICAKDPHMAKEPGSRMARTRVNVRRVACALILATCWLGACGDDPQGGGQGELNPDRATPASVYVVGSTLNGPEGWNAYVAVIPQLAPQQIDYAKALEIPGRADVWVWDKKVFIAEAQSPTVKRYAVAEDLSLVQEGTVLSFAAQGLPSAQFWNAIWLTPEKAYMNNIGNREYIVWNPRTMEIAGRIAHPALEERPGFEVRNSSTNRGSVVRDGRLYHSYYWTDKNYEKYTADSRIAVYDIATEQLVSVIEAPCPGLDVATKDDAGNLYFSSWTGLPGLSLVLGQPTSCAVKIPAGSETIDPNWTVTWPSITEGRHAAALRYQGGNHALVSVFHHERVTYDSMSNAFALVGTENWQTWRLDLSSRTATPLADIAPNSGAIYVERIGAPGYALIPTENYQSSQIYEINGSSARPLFKTRGWCTRLFQLQ